MAMDVLAFLLKSTRPLSVVSTQRHQRGVNSLIPSCLDQLYLALLGTTRYHVNRMSYHRV